MDFGLVGAKHCNDSGVGHNTSLQDAEPGHKQYCVRAGGHARANALCESDEIVGKGADPHIFVGSADEIAILKGADGDFVNDGITFTLAVLLGSMEKMGGIYKAGASVGGRGKLCSSRKLRSGSN